MRSFSLRTRLLVAAAVFVVLVVGGILLAAYVIVSDALTAYAEERPERDTQAVQRVLDAQAQESVAGLSEGGVLPGSALSRARGEFLRRVEMIYGERSKGEPQIAILDSSLAVLWASSRLAVVPALDSQRRAAMEQGEQTSSTVEQGSLFSGLFGPTVLAIHVVHSPILLPGGERGVIDVVDYPVREEQIIDSMRAPMVVLAVLAVLGMMVIMYVSIGWILVRVNHLRIAADSVDASRLDVRLPEEGQHEIGDLARSVNALMDRLRHRAEMQTRFVADASHELATPVAGIRGYANILREWGGENAEVREEAVAAIDRESRRMARLCEELLSLMRADTVSVIRRIPLNINSLVREVLAAAATRYHWKDHTFQGPERDELWIEGDPERLEDVLSIVVDNACKYTPPGGKVSVSTRSAGEWVIVEVRDSGIGISESNLSAVFERFYRSDESRSEVTGGFGLGLAIARSTIEAVGGTISVESAPGAGSLFRIQVPYRCHTQE